MELVLGFLGMIVWIVGVIALAAGITYVVVKIFPDDDTKPDAEAPAESS